MVIADVVLELERTLNQASDTLALARMIRAALVEIGESDRLWRGVCL